jgi:hypothetical protein
MVGTALAMAAPVSAQWKPPADADLAAPATPTAVTMASAPGFGGIASSISADEAREIAFVAPPLPGAQRTSRDVALMIVGGAALILGAVIGDDAGAVLMVGGGVVGLVGLYDYLR